MTLLVAQTRDKTNADRLMKFLKKAGSTHVHGTYEKDGQCVVKFTRPSAIEKYLLHRKSHGRRTLNKILKKLGSRQRILALLFDGSSDAIALREKVIAIAREQISDFPR
jgi:hypothetical protein